MAPRTKRILALFVPSGLAAVLTPHVERHVVLRVGVPVLVMLWTVMAGALLARFALAKRELTRRSGAAGFTRSRWAELDVLTASGATTLWLGAGAILMSAGLGWASLAVIGVLGLAVVYLAVTWTVLATGNDAPWRSAIVTRAITPAICTEGDPLHERVELTGVRIPAGMRLFATGRAHEHGAVSRYVVSAAGSNCSLVLDSELGAAQRGEHRAAPLELWFGDVLGLTRSPSTYRTEASFTVLPKARAVDGARLLLGDGGDAELARPAQQLPTEGTFRIRDYVPGDDTRRIHWVRSLARDELVVRLPDELPPAEPDVRLVLDNELYCGEMLSCRAPGELLDALVRVWLGTGKALAELGTRVTLATAVAIGDKPVATIDRTLSPRAMHKSLQLGAQVMWQSDVPLSAIVRPRSQQHPVKQIVVTSRPRRSQLAAEVAWIVVPEVAWTSPEHAPWIARPAATLPFPLGAAQNRASRLDAEHRRIERMWNDRAVFSQIVCWTDWSTCSGDHIARPDNGRIALAVIP